MTSDTNTPETRRRYLEGVAGDGSIALENENQWKRYAIVPRMFQEISRVDASTTLFGATASFPVLVAPSGGHGLGHPSAESGTAEGAARAGIPFTRSQGASSSFAEVTSHGGAVLQQLYLPARLQDVSPLLEQAREAGVLAFVVTVDQPAIAWQHAFRRDMFPDIAPKKVGSEWAVSVSLDDIHWLAQEAGRPVIVKGILHPDDAILAIDAGASGIVVSNHGGRQIGGSVTPPEVLSEISDAVGGRVPVLVDSGIRTEDDIFRAIALGADAALIGRPIVRALWEGGATAVADYLIDLREAFEALLALVGTPTLAEITRASVRLRH